MESSNSSNKSENLQNVIDLTSNLTLSIAERYLENEIIREPNYRPVESEENNQLNDLTNTMEIDDNEMTSHNNSNNKKQRFSNKIEFKIKAVEFYRSIGKNAYKASKDSELSLGKHVPRQYFSRWDKNYEDFLKIKNDNYSIRKRKYKNLTGRDQAKYPEIDKNVLEKVLEKREMGLSVSQYDIREFAKKACEEINKDRPVQDQFLDFKASPGYAYRFIQRNQLACRAATSVGQKIPPNAKQLALAFFDYNKNWFEKIPIGPVGNMDEIPTYVDAPLRRTYVLRGIKTVKMKTTGREKMRFTLVVTILSDGRKCRSMIIFKNLQKPPTPPKGTVWPANVFVSASKGGSMSEEQMYKWIKEVWKKSLAICFNRLVNQTFL